MRRIGIVCITLAIVNLFRGMESTFGFGGCINNAWLILTVSTLLFLVGALFYRLCKASKY